MKIQDIFFLGILIFLIIKRDEKLINICGIVSLVLAIPLFATWTFFTAERLMWYAAAFFLLSVILNLFKLGYK